jgi:hypothetical protein
MTRQEQAKDDWKRLFKMLTHAQECRCKPMSADAEVEDSWWTRMAHRCSEDIERAKKRDEQRD